MFLALKQLAYVLLISGAILWLAKPVVLLYWTAEDFSRRRNIWFLITVVAFLAPNFWIFCLVSIPTLVIAGRRDPNPTALYLLLLNVIPPIAVTLPSIGVTLFDVDNFALLAFFLLIPTALRMRRDRDRTGIKGFRAMDFFLLCYGILTSILIAIPEALPGVLLDTSVTNDVRHIFLFVTLTFLPYWVISRSLVNREALREAMVAFCLSCAIMAAIAIFESASHWLLYGDIANRWGYGGNSTLYLMRGGSIRASASSGHPLVLGYSLCIAFGFWLHLQKTTDKPLYRYGFFALLWAGLFASFARGAWIATVFTYFAYAALSPKAFSKLVRASGMAAIAAVIVSFTPLGERIVSYIPFLGGTKDSDTYTYRQRVADRCWQIIQSSPFFGDQTAVLKMQDLRQGEGIIDLLNAYIVILMDNGVIGLGLFLAFIVIGLLTAISLARRMANSDPDLSRLGACIAACILGSLLFIADGNLGGGVERMFYVLAAFSAAYGHLDQPVLRGKGAQFRLRNASKPSSKISTRA
jgi:hypothetical protein